MTAAEAVFFMRPNRIERTFSRFLGLLVGRFGLGLGHHYVLEVRGRKTGRLYSTPVNLFEFAGRRYLVFPRGRTQWVRNAQASGRVTLTKGRYSADFTVQPIPDQQKPELLKEYLRRFKAYVQRCFPIGPDAQPAEFVAIANRYPVFELLA